MERVNNVSLGQVISKRRKHLRMTQEILAEKLNVSKSAIAKWETDRGMPDRDNFARLSEILGVSMEDLYRLSENRNDRIYQDINITGDIIATLESYGYIVIPPNEK